MKIANSTLIACLTTLALGPLGCDPSVQKEDSTAGDSANEDAGDEDDSNSGVDEEDDDGEDDASTGVGTASSSESEGESATTGEDPGETEGESDSSVDPPPVDGYTAFAIRFGDIPDIDVESGSGGSGSDTTDGGSDVDPDALQINISTGAKTCEDPYAALPCGGHWSVSLTLAPEQQVVGTYLLFEETNGFFTETGEVYPEGDCSWGGGTLEGTVEITEITATQVIGVVLTDGIFAPTEIEFVAPRCG